MMNKILENFDYFFSNNFSCSIQYIYIIFSYKVMLIFIYDVSWLWAFTWILSLALALIIPARSIIIITHHWPVLQAHQGELILLLSCILHLLAFLLRY